MRAQAFHSPLGASSPIGGPNTAASPISNTSTTVPRTSFTVVSCDTNDGRPRMQIPWRHITKVQLDGICRALVHREMDAPIYTVDFMDNQLGPGATKKIAACLESTPVTEILICYNDIGKDGCDGLADVVNLSHVLQILDLRGNHLLAGDVHRLLRSVSMSTSLRRLGLASNKLGPEGAALMAKALERNTYLTSLDLSMNELGPSGAECIAGILRNPVSPLESLQMHGNFLGPIGVSSICDAVKNNKVLKRLTIGNNHATDEAAAAIAGMLEANYTLEALDVRLNTITAVGVKLIARQGLAKNTSLRSLSLSGNEVGPVGANELAQVLSAHQRSVLEHLDLSSCSLAPSGGVRIASLLSTSISLKEANFSDNGLDDEAASRLAQNITDGIAIAEVDVSCNDIGEEGASQLIDAVLRNAQLVALVMHGNKISRVSQKKMVNLLEERITKNRVLSRHTALYQQQKLTQQQQHAARLAAAPMSAV